VTSAREIAAFQRSVLGWYQIFKRDLPWTGDTDPYRILVSEVMLQQTQASRVIPKYHEFLARFPTLESLAAASTADVLRAWKGLGYNRRALNLKRAATAAREAHGGLPRTVHDLEMLPGVGKYTSRAVASFAFGVQVAVVDTNVRRVLSDFAGRRLAEKETWELAQQVLPKGRAAEWNQALMDYGALVRKAPRARAAGKQAPFATTNRFWRGRILDVLRTKDRLTLNKLLEGLPIANRDEQRVRGLVRALHEEGLVHYDAAPDRVQLPG
jgi:A/G-specific adenine glycosylase